MDWRDLIYSNPNIYGGKPIFVDSRITVEMVLDLMAAGWSVEQMAEEYPGIKAEYLSAAAAFAAELIHDEEAIARSRARAA
ncbi:MAG: hypothetical protein A4S12_03350 [Proteobacteria bacterium SG_bin5]|nr:DUF433 domain-containing protein [Sphingomonas sp.]OQW44463.1 MAG: hypothetical protein A4S12_03350 [Proteobacteria bacterium SG_bin5]